LVGWWAHGNFHASFLELTPQKGINKGTTPTTFSMFNTILRYDLEP